MDSLPGVAPAEPLGMEKFFTGGGVVNAFIQEGFQVLVNVGANQEAKGTPIGLENLEELVRVREGRIATRS